MKPIDLIVSVVDDDEDCRVSLSRLLASRGYQVQAFESGETFLQLANTGRYGVAILDRNMGAVSGVDVFEALQKRASPLVALFLSGHGDIPVAVDVTKRGAFAWLEKPYQDAALTDALASALVEAAAIGARHQAKREALGRWDTLTPREKGVAPLLRQGLSSKLIGKELDVGWRTVDTHRANVFDKLQVANAADLERYMRDNEL
jgi:FixJ family two-component response regulator